MDNLFDRYCKGCEVTTVDDTCWICEQTTEPIGMWFIGSDGLPHRKTTYTEDQEPTGPGEW